MSDGRAGRIVIRRTDTPIWRAYALATMSSPCPSCSAPAHVWCTKPDGRVRRTPCLARINAVASDTAEPHDFGEPRHQPEEHPQ